MSTNYVLVMSYELALVLVVLVVTVVLFATEKLAVDVVALLALAVLLIGGVLPPEEALAGFSNEAVVTIGAMFILSAGLYRSGTLNQLRQHFESAARKDPWLALVGLMVAAGVSSAFINNTAVVAILIPIILATSQKLRVSASKFLMPLSFASMFGGVCTLIGTSTNLLVSAIADDYGLEPFGMFEFAGLGLVFFAVGGTYMLTVGARLVPPRRGMDDLADSWRVADYVTELVLSPEAQSVGKSLVEAPLTRDRDVDVIQIRREGEGLLPSGETVLEAGDFLRVRCNVTRLQELLRREGVLVQPRTKWEDQDLESTEVVLVEVVIASGSPLEGETLRSSEFRNRFSGIVIALRHRGTLVREALADVRLRAGDALLVEIARRRLPQFRASDAFVVVSEVPDPESFRPSKAMPAMAILALVIGLAAVGVAPIVVTATGGAVAMILFGCLTPEEAYRAVDWRVIFLLAGVLALGVALERTGAAELLSRGLILGLGGLGPVVLLSAVYLATTLLTESMSNNAAAVLLAPIAITAAVEMGVDPKPFLMAVTFAASASFMTPVGYQTNTMVYGPGQYRFMDFVRVGGPLNLIFWVLATVLIPWFWPL